MNVFELRDQLLDDYRRYATSFMRLRDERIQTEVQNALDQGLLWPPPRIGLNPAFETGTSVESMVNEGILHPGCQDIFGTIKPYRHQEEAIRAAQADRNYVLTTGTGSGKSLAYIIPIVDHVLRTGSGTGVKAVVIYPMNALANSQMEELAKFLPGSNPPVTFNRYSGQEDQEARDLILNDPPDILLTNYVMMELILTRYRDKALVKAMGDLRFLVLDELHSYRGRQGADVALLVRRVREASGSAAIRCVGTSATLSTEGGHQERLTRLAKVGTRLFGAKVHPEDVIGETLRRLTPEPDLSDPTHRAELGRAIWRNRPPKDFEAFAADPLSGWIETEFGIGQEEGRLVRAIPRALEGDEGAAARLSALTDIDQESCENALRSYLLAGHEIRNPTTAMPVFAFRLHQFISRGDTVYASPESPGKRALTLQGRRFVPGDRTRVLLPLSFCRACGQDYYVVRRGQAPDNSEEEILTPRDLRDRFEEENRSGFLYLSDDHPWPDDSDRILDRLPPTWLDPNGRLRPNRRGEVPQRVEVMPDGRLLSADSIAEGGVPGWWTPTPFRFCLACGVSYPSRLGSDFSRLATLGSEGRSTATTIMSLAVVHFLRQDGRLPSQARKLLSFTDNRQDASLQAGHFNDFVQVTQLRSALWQAAAGRPDGLRHDDLSQQVFDKLGLPADQYALDPDLRGGAALDTDQVLREVLAYRLYRDLKRGWRLTQPNLEQTGLLTIEYQCLQELSQDESNWKDCHPSLVNAGPEHRHQILTVMLDWIRRELGIKVDVLDRRHQERLVQRADQRLIGPWSLADDSRQLEPSTRFLTRTRQRYDGRDSRYMTGRSAFGQFLRRQDGLSNFSPEPLTVDSTTEIIRQMAERLRRYGLLVAVDDDGENGSQWQIPAAALIWKSGDGTKPYVDQIRMPGAPEEMPTNPYFVDRYRTSGSELSGIEAREHTAQVSYEQRIEREQQFREARLPVLFCSPTMELGVDISELNVVNMRNVPPTPANYAQRSGRAGRSGQPALVFTYCSVGSPHDQHFFGHQEEMISGQVEAPRVDLTNEDLVRAHVHSVWLAESGLDLGRSMGDILDLTDGETKPEITDQIRDSLNDPNLKARAKVRAQKVLESMGSELADAPWWSDTWLTDTLNKIHRRFEDALKRWQSLYSAALAQAREQGKIAMSANRSEEDRRKARRLRSEAEKQLDLLRAQSDQRGQSDFYTYRYLAAEGFLPGYSFPRLPLSAFIPGRRHRSREGGEFLQRPRFLAISEFGPRSYLYHEGARYLIDRVILDPADNASGTQSSGDEGSLVTQTVKRCTECGYMHEINTPPGPDVCHYCHSELGPAWTNLIRMRNVSTRRRDRITSDEEERFRIGYELISGVQFAEHSGRYRIDQATVTAASPEGSGLSGEEIGDPLLELAYGKTATVWRVNQGWRRRKNPQQHGFVLDIESGVWGRQDKDSAGQDDPLSARTHRVVPYVTDTRNALLVKPSMPPDLATMASLEAALKAAFEAVFQLEPGELAAEPLPSRDDRRLLLFYESAEGGAGVLRRLIHDEPIWRRVAREALRRCHFDPDTLEDVSGSRDGDRCEAACYQCLLTYRNQMDHQLLDRDTLADRLAQLRDAEIIRSPEGPPPESSLEQEFLDRLEKGGYRMPDRSQVYFKAAKTRPDFVYDDACAVIYVDGPHHDYPERAKRDQEANRRMMNLGYQVIRFGLRDDWDRIIRHHRPVFGPGRAE